ncbi:FtsB family cell division protein [Luteolibacter sp. AS25]|uniref:FtsB family cell division protein n=1 Tax=Luteolibacter sp. AS25 TaxID=3135776 RepID=UPI00398AAE29
MAKKRYTHEKIARIEATTRIFKGVSRFLYIGLAVAFGLLIAATAVPQKRKYEELLGELSNIQKAEEAVIAKKEHKQIELFALREDDSFLEVQARDRLNYYREGERILRFDPNR